MASQRWTRQKDLAQESQVQHSCTLLVPKSVQNLCFLTTISNENKLSASKYSILHPGELWPIGGLGLQIPDLPTVNLHPSTGNSYRGTVTAWCTRIPEINSHNLRLMLTAYNRESITALRVPIAPTTSLSNRPLCPKLGRSEVWIHHLLVQTLPTDMGRTRRQEPSERVCPHRR